eukprot:gb/GFBE01082083.1/.p1 GENE.gb/GFBE01082083.1/~~gb/GFBE01082083.1/.p1  ORF type:complete len:607 (+),score=134.02 gb/GFBE01082083.1/:1-1821(+)
MGCGGSVQKQPAADEAPEEAPEQLDAVLPRAPPDASSTHAAGAGHRVASLRRVHDASTAASAAKKWAKLKEGKRTKTSTPSAEHAAKVRMHWRLADESIEAQVSASHAAELLLAAQEAYARSGGTDKALEVVCCGFDVHKLDSGAALLESVGKPPSSQLVAYMVPASTRSAWVEGLAEMYNTVCQKLVEKDWWDAILSEDLEASERFLTASSAGNPLMDESRRLLLCSKGVDGRTAVEMAVDEQQEELLRHLAVARADLSGAMERTLRLRAGGVTAGKEAETIGRLLCSQGAVVEAWQPLSPAERCIRAAATGCDWLMEETLRAEGLRDHIDQVVDKTSGWTLLHQAAVSGNEALLKTVLQKAPHLAQRCDSNGRGPFHHAAQEGWEDLLPILGLSMAGDKLRDACDLRDELGRTPLWLAARGGHVGCCKWLVQQGCDPLRRDLEGTCPVWQAVRGPGSQEETQKLLPALLGARPSLDASWFLSTTVDNNRFTVLHAAAREDAVSAMKWMVDHATDGALMRAVAARSCMGDTALQLAALEGHVQAVSLLIEWRADPGSGGPGSARDWATLLGHDEVAALLFEHVDELADAKWASRWLLYKAAATSE